MPNKSILIPLITPLSIHKEVCEQSVKALIDRSKTYAEGFIPCLTSGEGWRLTEDQWRSMVEYSHKYAPTHELIAGIERATTQEVMHYAKLAVELGANGVIITSPFGESVSQQDIYHHYKTIHDQFDLDIYIYNESELSLNNTSAETLLKISELSRVVGIKESSNSVEFNAIRDRLKANGVRVYQGWEDKIVDDSIADGNICSLSNLYPQLCLQAAIEPSAALKLKIGELCDRHQIFSEDWYAHIKEFLSTAGVIASDQCIDPA